MVIEDIGEVAFENFGQPGILLKLSIGIEISGAKPRSVDFTDRFHDLLMLIGSELEFVVYLLPDNLFHHRHFAAAVAECEFVGKAGHQYESTSRLGV